MTYLKVWTSFRESIAPLQDAEKGRLFDAMLKYAETGEEPSEFKGNERFLWAVAKQDIDRTAQKCEALRANASKGGLAKSRNQQMLADDSRYYQSVANDSNDQQTEAKSAYKEKKRNKKKDMDDDDDDDDDSIARAREEVEMWDAVSMAIETQLGRNATPAEVEQVCLRARLARQTPEMAALAVRKAAANGARNLGKYVARIFDEWSYHEVRTPEEAEEHQVMYDESNGNVPWAVDPVESYTRMEEARERRRQEHGSGAAGA